MRSFFMVMMPGIAAVIASLAFAAFLLWLAGCLSRGVLADRRGRREARTPLLLASQKEQRLIGIIDSLSSLVALLPNGIPFDLRRRIDNELNDSRGVRVHLSKD